jgi:hypothetical protein
LATKFQVQQFMSQLDKLRTRICTKPKDFIWDELVQVAISLPKPHPGNILKEYQLNEIIALLGIC